MFIDSHAHLEGKRYDADRDEVLARAKDDGIETYLAIGNGEGPDTADCGIKLAEKYNKPVSPMTKPMRASRPGRAILE
jgi:TatD DNase family protein